jgi:hypothetical protein
MALRWRRRSRSDAPPRLTSARCTMWSPIAAQPTRVRTFCRAVHVARLGRGWGRALPGRGARDWTRRVASFHAAPALCRLPSPPFVLSHLERFDVLNGRLGAGPGFLPAGARARV